MALFHSFLWPSNILLHVGGGVHAQHIFFIHSFIDERLGCFHVLVIENRAAINNDVHIPFQISFLSFQIYAQEWACWIIW